MALHFDLCHTVKRLTGSHFKQNIELISRVWAFKPTLVSKFLHGHVPKVLVVFSSGPDCTLPHNAGCRNLSCFTRSSSVSDLGLTSAAKIPEGCCSPVNLNPFRTSLWIFLSGHSTSTASRSNRARCLPRKTLAQPGFMLMKISRFCRGGPHMRSLISIDFPAPKMEPESEHVVSAVSVHWLQCGDCDTARPRQQVFPLD